MPVASRSRVPARWFLLVALALVFAGGLVWGVTAAPAASPSPTSSSSSTSGVVLKLGWTEEPDNLNVFIGYNSTDWELWALNYDYLFRCGTNQQPTLDLATQFPTKQNGGISADGKVWTIHIRSGVKFDDGTPLTASDVAFTYNYVIKNNIAQYTTYIDGIKKAVVVNPTTVQFVCAHSMATGYMETQSVPIVPEHIWLNVSPKAATTSYGNKPPIIGSGPFETVAFDKGSYIKMVRNPYWWGKKPTISTIYFETYQNADTMVADMRAGRVDGIEGDIPEGEFTQLKSFTGVKAVSYPFYEFDDVEMNCFPGASSQGNPVLRDPKFRQALDYAIDRQKLCQLSYGGYATPGTTVITPHTFVNPDYHWQPPADATYTFDLAKAGQLLTAAGYPLKNGVRVDKQGKPIVLRLETPTGRAAGASEAKLITGWLQQLGLKINFSVIDSGALESKMWNEKGNVWEPDFDLVVWDYVGNYDAGQTIDYFTTSQWGDNNDMYWGNATFDKLAVEQASETDPQVRKDIIWKMQQIMYQQSPNIVLLYADSFQAFNTAKWTGWAQLWGTGPAWNSEGNITSYLDLKPVAATTSSTGASTTLIVVIVIVVVAGVVTLVLVRRRARHVENEM